MHVLVRLLLVLSAQFIGATVVRSRLVQIPEDYDKTTAPPLVDGKPNVIKITADIFSIPDFDEKDEVCVCDFNIRYIYPTLDKQDQNSSHFIPQ